MYDVVKRLREPCQYENCVLCQEAADAIEELEFVCNRYEKDYKDLCDYLPKWIPVTERLPEKDTRVIVCASLPEGIHSDFIYEDGHWFVSTGVTHWMPFPEPPKEE